MKDRSENASSRHLPANGHYLKALLQITMDDYINKMATVQRFANKAERAIKSNIDFFNLLNCNIK